jgi:poly(3-hydroxybutyrate) depolymerase
MNYGQFLALPARRRNYAVFTMAILLAVSGGCAKEKVDTPVPKSEIIVEPNQRLSTAPHRFDVYRPEDADKAVVFLHGGGGSRQNFAHALGLKRDASLTSYAVANEQVLIDNHTIAVFPQGQSIATAPSAYTWNNYVMDSGQDDVKFIRDLVAFIAAQYNVSKMYLVGHSSGGMMVSRVWCEAPELFDACISIAGPPSEHFLDNQTPCSPAAAIPFLNIVGAKDDVLQNDDWEAQTWIIDPVLAASPAFVNPNVIGMRFFLPTMVTRRCGETVQAGDADAVKNGTLATWSFCGDSIRLIRVESAGHSLESLEAESGSSMVDLVYNFISQLE